MILDLKNKKQIKAFKKKFLAGQKKKVSTHINI
jgi:hypothetical protein